MWLLHLLAQQAPDVSNQWPGIVSGVGTGGLATGILWKVLQNTNRLHEESELRHDARHEEDRKTIAALTSRLFLLADRGMAVGQTASEVAASESGTDPELLAQMQELRALLEQRGGR